MTDIDTLDERLCAVERALTGDEQAVSDLKERAELTDSIDELAERMERVEHRLDELDAAAQALRGYVGNIRAVNADVERRADAALAAVESLDGERTHEPVLEPSGTRPERAREQNDEEENGAETERAGLIDSVRGVL